MWLLLKILCVYVIRFDEIVVGAPTYSEGDNIDVGQIHVYVNVSVSHCYK